MKQRFYLLTLSILIAIGTTQVKAQKANSKIVLGCMSSSAKNYNKLATKDNGSCIYYGDTLVSFPGAYQKKDSIVTMPNALKNDSISKKPKTFKRDTLVTMPNAYQKKDSIVTMPNTSTKKVVYGCMSSSAKNYNKLATKDNGSCIYYGDTLVTLPNAYQKKDSIITMPNTLKKDSIVTTPISYSQSAITGIKNQVQDSINSISLYPIPAIENLTVQFVTKQSGIVQLCVVKLNGVKVISKQITATEGINKSDINVSELQKGIYFIVISKNNKVISSRKFSKN